MHDFILKEESFGLGLLDKAPSAKAEECLILYYAGEPQKRPLVINYGERYSSTGIRRAHYNRKVTISLKTQKINLTRKLSMKDCDFYFNIQIELACMMRDVNKYYFEERKSKEDIVSQLKEVLKNHEEKWNAWEHIKVQNEIEKDFLERLKVYESVEFVIRELIVDPDEDAERMVKSNREKMVGIHISKNATDLKLAENEQFRRVIESEFETKKMKIKEMAMMTHNFGSLGPVVEKYINGEVDGEQLFGYIRAEKNSDINMLKMAMSNDLLTQDEAIDRLNKIFTESKYIQLEENNKLSKTDVYEISGEEDLVVNQAKVISETSEKEIKDGDYI